MKLFVEEAQSPWATTLATRATGHIASALTWVELRAGLALKGRTGQIESAVMDSALSEVDDFWPRVQVVDVTPAVIRRAGRLAIEQGLRACDSVQLSTASIAVEGIGERVQLCTFDLRLKEAAERIGLRAWFPPDQ